MPKRFAIGSWLLAATASVLLADPAEEFQKDIRPILEKHCYDCHGEDQQKGDLNLQTFSDFEKIKEAPEIWENVFERVQAFEMPPKGKRELNFDQQGKMVRWLRELPKPEEPDCDKIASDRTANFYRGYVMSRRLNRAEYQNTIRDLFGVELDVLDMLPADSGGGEGFDTTGNALFISTIHIEKYLAAANHILETVLPEKPRQLSPELKEARTRLLMGKGKPRAREARAEAETIVKRFARLAFRRPPTSEEVERSMTMFDRAWERDDGFIPSVRLALKSVLISPNFLFLAEPEPEEQGVQPLAPLPLASKLSYFLWSSMPDEELLSLAESGQLLDPNIYLAQVRRMLADPKAEALGRRFALQWLDVERLGVEVKPDAEKFPEYDPVLRDAMLAEVSSVFNYIIQGNRSLVELIDTDYTFVNQRLAELYEIPDVEGSDLQMVSLPDKTRGGVIGMAAVHTRTSHSGRTSPVLRGHWVLEALLGDKVPPPPPDTPTLEETTEKAKNLSLREQLELHRASPNCSSCHDKMDPLGFGMENFDVLGRWRDADNGQAIDSKGILPSGETFTGPTGLKTVLMARKDKVMKHLVRKMTGYAFGRELNKFDNCVVDRTVEELQKNDYRAWIMVEQVALSFPFRHRFYPKQEVNL